MTTTVGLVTTDTALVREHDPDTAVLLRALTEAGFRASAPVWHDPAVDWAAFDLLVIRSPWDYPERYAEFTGWLARVAGSTRILNAPELIHWNIDKRYLDDFRALDVPCVPYATGQPVSWDEEVLGFLHDEVAKTAELGRELGEYGAETPVPPDAPVLDRMLGLTGRDPYWARTPPA
ncbi:hypothetical protein GCM10020358_14420 [Amorphoplanes nipponensis]|uniref:hypothetical protein n=1 Tax=Actinoplanes nipponensis TaxID=135950 RepID=UPI0031E90564